MEGGEDTGTSVTSGRQPVMANRTAAARGNDRGNLERVELTITRTGDRTSLWKRRAVMRARSVLSVARSWARWAFLVTAGLSGEAGRLSRLQTGNDPVADPLGSQAGQALP